MQLTTEQYAVASIGHLKSALGHELTPHGTFAVAVDNEAIAVVTQNANADGSANADGTPSDAYHCRVYGKAPGTCNVTLQYTDPDGTQTPVQTVALTVVEPDAVTEEPQLSDPQSGTSDQAVPK